MRGPDGGSLHDPGARLPDSMWNRLPKPTDEACKVCQNTSVRKGTKKYLVAGQNMSVLVCFHCDGGVFSIRT